MVSCVVAKMAHYPHVHSFEQVYDLLVLVTPPDSKKKNLTYCNIWKGLPESVTGRLPRLCERWNLGMIPAVQWSSNKPSTVEVVWPTTLQLPGPIRAIIPLDHLNDLFLKMFADLGKPTSCFR